MASCRKSSGSTENASSYIRHPFLAAFLESTSFYQKSQTTTLFVKRTTKGVEGVRNPSMHRGASCAKMVENYQDARWPRSAQGVMPLKVIAVLMPFGSGRIKRSLFGQLAG